MTITTYLTAKAHDKPFTALPVFVLRQFNHSLIAYNIKSGVQSPKDLEGKKVGVRAYTVATGVGAKTWLPHHAEVAAQTCCDGE
jgi:4,5-dihydroxyphthalate decarboxylase